MREKDVSPLWAPTIFVIRAWKEPSTQRRIHLLNGEYTSQIPLYQRMEMSPWLFSLFMRVCVYVCMRVCFYAGTFNIALLSTRIKRYIFVCCFCGAKNPFNGA